MRCGICGAGGAALMLTAACLFAAAPGPAPSPQEPGIVLLDTFGVWRMHHTLGPPVIESGGTSAPVLYGYQWMDMPTPEPPDDWAAPGFNDGAWLRGPARMSCRTPYLKRLCLRGSFAVADPAQAGELKLTLLYQGGAIVYLNGKEIARDHVAAAQGGRPAMAESYPPEAFTAASGKLLRGWEKKESDQDAETQRRLALRTRAIRDLRLPKDQLRNGLNVLAIEILRAPYAPAVDTGKASKGFAAASASRSVCELDFNTCELTGVQLAAPTAAGLPPRDAQGPGLQVWNSDVLLADHDLDFRGPPAEPLRPVRIVAARNGAFSGKFVAGSAGPLRKLQVSVSDLSGPNGTIPASAVQVRYAQPWGSEAGAYGLNTLSYDKSSNGAKGFRYELPPVLLGALMDAPPPEVPVAAGKRASPYYLADARIPSSPPPVLGATLPVWLTVHVPKDARGGDYAGKAVVRAEGGGPVEVPLQLRVSQWTVPDPERFTTWIDMIQSPDTLALEYDAPLWSPKHWKLIDRSMEILRAVGNRVLYLPLVAQSNLGNAETLVRWVDQGGGRYGYDCSELEQYLDHALQHMGKPSIVVLYAWDIYFAAYKQLKPLNDELELKKDVTDVKKSFQGKGPMVTVLDPATGKVEARHLPLLLDPNSGPLWQGLFRQVTKRLKDRGLDDRAMLGTMSDAWPTKDEVDFYGEVAGDLRWFSDSHMGIAGLKQDMETLASGKASKFEQEAVYTHVKNAKDELTVLGKASYSARVWSSVFGEQNKTGDSLLGWKSPELYVQHDRHADVHPMTRWHFMAEENILGEQRGVGRLGGDWWRCVKDKAGRRSGLARDRYPQSFWRNLDMNIQMLAPGAEGAVATHRFENLREGVQECEARIGIEKALTDPELKGRLGAELAGQAQELLRRRANLVTKACSNLQMGGAEYDQVLGMRAFFVWPNIAGHCWLASADWQQMNEDLFAMAAAVEARLGK
jgi:hypothetical protein